MSSQSVAYSMDLCECVSTSSEMNHMSSAGVNVCACVCKTNDILFAFKSAYRSNSRIIFIQYRNKRIGNALISYEEEKTKFIY